MREKKKKKKTQNAVAENADVLSKQRLNVNLGFIKSRNKESAP